MYKKTEKKNRLQEKQLKVLNTKGGAEVGVAPKFCRDGG
jgi:hypothetical protein